METEKGVTTVPDFEQRPRGGQVLLGLALIVLGLGFLLHRLDLWHIHLSARYWPFILIFIGAARLLYGPFRTRRGRTRRGGVWMINIGLWGLISEFQLFGLDYGTSWPLLIVAVGLNIVWRSLEEPRSRKIQEN
jgi:hypothetical protein